MAGLPLLAFGCDRRWSAHLQRILAPRWELEWRGTPDAETAAVAAAGARRAIWLLDGDDPRIARLPARRTDHLSPRIYCFRTPDVSHLRRCAHRGASGCLEKLAPLGVLTRAIRSVESGLFAVDASLLARALTTDRRGPAPLDNLDHLTDRQREIVHWVALGMSNKQIGRRLGISPETVKSHLHQVFEREGISGRVALLALHRPE